MLSCVLALSLFGAPFDDIHRRFTIELPEGWSYAPLPGDDGATFRKASAEGALGNFNIGALPRTEASLEETVRAFARYSEREPGYRELSRGPVAIAATEGLRRRFVTQVDARTTRMVEERFVLTERYVFVLHAESLAEAFPLFEADFEALFAAFRPKGMRTIGELIDSPLVGRWVMLVDNAVIFDLRADGTFELAGTRGTWRSEGRRLFTKPNDGIEEGFEWRLGGVPGDPSIELLELRSEGLAGSIRYRRQGGAGRRPQR